MNSYYEPPYFDGPQAVKKPVPAPTTGIGNRAVAAAVQQISRPLALHQPTRKEKEDLSRFCRDSSD